MARPIPRAPPVTIATFPVKTGIDYYNTRADGLSRDRGSSFLRHMTTVAIIGAGELGGATAQALAARESADRVILVDAAADVAAGKALDIQQANAIDRRHARLEGTGDPSRAIGCSVCVVADRAGRPSSEWQGEEGLAMLARLARYLANAPIVFAGAAQADLIALGSREVGLPRARLIGSSPEALVAALAAIVALEARCSSAEVSLAVLGVPPAGFVVPWSDATVGGYALDRVLAPVQLARLEARAARLWPPGPFALGAAAAWVITGLLQASRRSFSVLTPSDREFGERHRAAAVPVVLAPPGIVHTRVPTLSARDRVRLDTALSA